MCVIYYYCKDLATFDEVDALIREPFERLFLVTPLAPYRLQTCIAMTAMSMITEDRLKLLAAIQKYNNMGVTHLTTSAIVHDLFYHALVSQEDALKFAPYYHVTSDSLRRFFDDLREEAAQEKLTELKI